MSIGEVLSDARCRSGLSIVEVSRQTRLWTLFLRNVLFPVAEVAYGIDAGRTQSVRQDR